ncbi:class I SAM-dependent methyltransferase [Candidatus Pelagibacter sp.]|nr:class I SAM-dependent methyltransferase [Candidatus Pelagibacter sp.]
MENLNPIKLFFNRIYYFLFIERFNKKLSFNFPKDIFRWDLIQFLINKYDYSTYLEIGCDKDQSFSKIKISHKVGVDPISGGTIRKTSDEFFKSNKEKFDIIFIDGLHHYEQVIVDINNALSVLNDNGHILVHDCLPRTIAHQAIPRYRGSWNGDVWKSIVELRTKSDLEVFTCKIDFGVGIVRKKNNNNPLKLNITDFKKLKFRDYYYKNREFMNIKTYNQILDII